MLLPLLVLALPDSLSGGFCVTKHTDKETGKRMARKKHPMIKGLGAIAALGSLLALSACGWYPITWPSDAAKRTCVADRADMTEQVDWDAVTPIRMRILDGDYLPMIMYFEKDRPYVLVVENADRDPHNLYAPYFFKEGVAMQSVQIGDNVPAEGCVNGVRIAPLSTVTLRFVPRWEGRYEVFDQPVRILPSQLPVSVMRIVQPRSGFASN